MSLRGFAGHLWTVAPTIVGKLAAPQPAPGRALEFQLPGGPAGAEIPFHGVLSENPGSSTLVVLLHGLGGTADSIYLARASSQFHDAGYSTLRFSMRGANGDGSDIYNAGLTDEVHAVLNSADVARFERVLLVGFSLGGHIMLSAATESLPANVHAAIAICSPLDLDATALAMDAPKRKIYREYVLRELRESFRRVADRGRHSTPWQRVDRVQTIREYDALTVVPRFGFRDVTDYYAQQSVARRLHELKIPSLYLSSEHDPMVPRSAVEHVTSKAPEALHVEWVNTGGHVYFPPDLDLGWGPPGLVGQLSGWFEDTKKAAEAARPVE